VDVVFMDDFWRVLLSQSVLRMIRPGGYSSPLVPVYQVTSSGYCYRLVMCFVVPLRSDPDGLR
jgi:hypothetical protein